MKITGNGWRCSCWTTRRPPHSTVGDVVDHHFSQFGSSGSSMELTDYPAPHRTRPRSTTGSSYPGSGAMVASSTQGMRSRSAVNAPVLGDSRRHTPAGSSSGSPASHRGYPRPVESASPWHQPEPHTCGCLTAALASAASAGGVLKSGPRRDRPRADAEARTRARKPSTVQPW